VQQAVNRVQSAEMTEAVVAGAHERGIGSVNVDLIYGLPHQTRTGFAATIERVLAMQPERLAVFNFAYLPTLLPHQRVIRATDLPSADAKLDLLETVFERLQAAGYAAIGMDHFARPSDPLFRALADRSLTRNFQGYSTWGETDLVGFGASAIGQVGGGFAQNAKDVVGYQEAIQAGQFATCRGLVMTPEDELRQDVIVRLMCHLQLDFGEVEERHGIDFRRHFASELEALGPLADDGLVDLAAEGVRVTPTGQFVVRNIAMVFDAYLGRKRHAFSRTV
ncbi:MAG: oxygen-independent coproporphyrinogen III oxidase, partial [Acidobacteriota bacterium]